MSSTSRLCVGFVAVWVTVATVGYWQTPSIDTDAAAESSNGGPNAPQPGRDANRRMRPAPVVRAVPTTPTTPTPSVAAVTATVIELTLTDPRVSGHQIRIKLAPELSGPISTGYMADLAALSSLLETATLFRAEPDNLVQGRVGDPRVPTKESRGPCPPGLVEANVKSSYCNCGCNGPTMRKGMVAWAGGHGQG
jgi:hypothetical protein